MTESERQRIIELLANWVCDDIPVAVGGKVIQAIIPHLNKEDARNYWRSVCHRERQQQSTTFRAGD